MRLRNCSHNDGHPVKRRIEMIANESVPRRSSWEMRAVLALFAVIVGHVAMPAQDAPPVPSVAETSGNDPELLKVIATQSRANLGKIQDWRGRARIHLKRVSKEATDGKPTEQTATVLVTFVYDLNRGDIHSDWVLEESVNFSDEPRFHLRAHLAQEYGRFSPVCWQFPMKFNVIGMAFQHWCKELKKEPKLPEGQITRSGSTVRFYMGPSKEHADFYEVDLDKGGSLVNWHTLRDGKVESTWKLEPQLVDDIWIPRKTTRVFNGPDFTEEETIDWFESEIK